ncbi:MAG: hypothetical protein KC493_00330 [Bacteriovoracaceae bacterium]|nr:hypothetical protein [Bacteriovoracaceae bacterium]
MHSKWFPWEFFRNNPSVIDFSLKGVHAVSVFDPFIESLVNHKLKKAGEFKIALGSEVDSSWIESKLSTMDLFSMGDNDSWLILRPEDMSKPLLERFIKGEITIDDRIFVMVFSSDNKIFDEMAKSNHINTLKMEVPRFWEQGKLLTFLGNEMGVQLNSEIQNYLLSAIPNTTQDFVHAIRTLRLETQGSSLTLEKVKYLISESRLDQFALASEFGKRNRKQFFKTLTRLEMDFDSLRSLFGFMQGHLAKILDPGYIQKKSRASKYDKEIEMHSKLWKQDELVSDIHQFSELELLAKQKNPLLKNKIREIYLGQY